MLYFVIRLVSRGVVMRMRVFNENKSDLRLTQQRNSRYGHLKKHLKHGG